MITPSNPFGKKVTRSVFLIGSIVFFSFLVVTSCTKNDSNFYPSETETYQFLPDDFVENLHESIHSEIRKYTSTKEKSIDSTLLFSITIDTVNHKAHSDLTITIDYREEVWESLPSDTTELVSAIFIEVYLDGNSPGLILNYFKCVALRPCHSCEVKNNGCRCKAWYDDFGTQNRVCRKRFSAPTLSIFPNQIDTLVE